LSSDYQLEDTVFIPFTTRAFATGIPTALAGTPAIDIYEDAGTSPIITGETLAVSINSVVGYNMITVTATAGTGFEAGKSYTAIIEAGTVDSVSVVGEVVGHFTLDMSAAAKDLANATDGLGAIKAETALIVADTNELQVDWVDNGRLDLIQDAILLDTGTTLNSKLNTIDTNVDSILVDTAEIGTAGAGLSNINLPNQTMDITGDLSGSVGSVTAGVTLANGAITDVSLAGNMVSIAVPVVTASCAAVVGEGPL